MAESDERAKARQVANQRGLASYEKYQMSPFSAAILGFVGFLSSFVALCIMVFVTWGALHPSLHRPEQVEELDEYIRQQAPPNEIAVLIICLPVAIAFGVLVYRVVRSPVTPNILFQTCFFAGLVLLGYSLWVALASYRTLLLLADDSLRLSGPMSALPICIVTIPIALLLLVRAVVSDRPQSSRLR